MCSPSDPEKVAHNFGGHENVVSATQEKLKLLEEMEGIICRSWGSHSCRTKRGGLGRPKMKWSWRG